MDTLKHFFHGKAISVVESLMPVLKESKFRETGILTPEEFVIAGDHMVHHCPTWQWGVSDKDMIRPYLPDDKQYLITRSVPCYKRVKQMCNHRDDQEKVIDIDDGDGGWVDTHHYADLTTEQAVTEILDDTTPDDGRVKVEYDNISNASSEEAMDMEEFEEAGMMDMDNQVVDIHTSTTASTESNTGILQTRTYDLHITYDKYYRTPRIWLYGYDENRVALSVKQLYEDISEDHANKTVTMENHPHIQGPPMASVHPCKHAAVMKRIIETVEEGGGELQVYMYLLIFLKFLQAVVPTIEYDFTRNFRM